jgi:hypothetical protein
MSQKHDRSQPGGGASRQNEKVSSSVASSQQDKFGGDYTTWDTTTREQFATLLVSQGIADYSQAMNAFQQGNGQQIATWKSQVMPGDNEAIGQQQYATQRQKSNTST